MKFNLINWILETISILINTVISSNDLNIIIYILVNSCGIPLVYIMGIEENRKTVKQILMSQINFLTKKNKVAPKEATKK